MLDVIENLTAAQRAVEQGRERAGDPRRGFDSQTAVGPALDTLALAGETYGWLLLLQPTSPLRTAAIALS